MAAEIFPFVGATQPSLVCPGRVAALLWACGMPRLGHHPGQHHRSHPRQPLWPPAILQRWGQPRCPRGNGPREPCCRYRGGAVRSGGMKLWLQTLSTVVPLSALCVGRMGSCLYKKGQRVKQQKCSGILELRSLGNVLSRLSTKGSV